METKLIKRIKFCLVALATFLVAFYVAANYDPALFNDSDQDGLSDAEEVAYGTDPENRDTDGDGYTDGVEVKSGFDPLKPAPGDRIMANNNSNEIKVAPQQGLTSELVTTVTTMLNDHGGESLSIDEIKSFFNDELGEELKNEIYTEIPEIDKNKVQTIKVDSALSEEEKDLQIKKNNILYITELATLFAETQPLERKIDSDEDMDVFFLEMQNKFMSNSPEEIDKDYVKKLALKADNFTDRSLKETKVPEELLEQHINLLGIMQALAELKDNSIINSSDQDPLSNIIVLVRLRTLLGALNDTYIEPINNKLNEL